MDFEFSKAIDKSVDACYQYETCRQKLQQVSSHISENPPCTESVESSCISLLWAANIEASISQRVGYTHNYEPRHVPLCINCRKLDELIQERKKLKQEFGKHKRAICHAGKLVIKEVEEAE